MTGTTATTGDSITSRRGGSLAAAAADSARGLVFTGLALAELGLIVALILEVCLAVLIYPLLLIPPTLLATRRLANVTRRLSGQWCQMPIPVPYRAYAEPVRGGAWRRFARAVGQLITEPATWRDLLWMTVDPTACCVLALIPAAAEAWGLFGVLMPAVWHPVVHAGGNDWYAFIHVTGTLRAWLCVPLGVAFIVVGLCLAPLFLRCYGRLAHSMLALSRRAAERPVTHVIERPRRRNGHRGRDDNRRSVAR